MEISDKKNNKTDVNISHILSPFYTWDTERKKIHKILKLEYTLSNYTFLKVVVLLDLGYTKLFFDYKSQFAPLISTLKS